MLCPRFSRGPDQVDNTKTIRRRLSNQQTTRTMATVTNAEGPQPLDFVKLVQTWVKQNSSKIHKTVLLKGGWEGWAQIEIVLYIQDHIRINKYDHKVLREQKIFSEDGKETQHRADIVLVDNSDQLSAILELKCQVLNEEAADTIMRLADDTAKLTVKDSKNVPKTAIAITVAENTERVVMDYNVNQAELNRLTCFKATGVNPVYIISAGAADLILFNKFVAQKLILQDPKGGEKPEGLGTNSNKKRVAAEDSTPSSKDQKIR